tara:strand:- start:109 stop:951 length:843 start_codon:yes stop_codon:yes gene_type:complete
MNYKAVTIGIVTFKSEKVILNCLKSIKKIKNIIIFDNSNDINLKYKIKKKYPKIKFILSKKNLGYGSGNNEILKRCKTKYLLILSPDTILKKNCEKELINAAINKKNKFSIISPLSNENNFGNFENNKIIQRDIFEVDFVKGFAMLFNKKKIKKIGMFDKNIFLYLEEIDLCKRLKAKGEKIFICSKSKVKHLGAKSSDIGFQYEKIRNWHWMWSSVYYEKKFNNIFNVYLKFSIKLIINLFKTIIYFIFFNNKKSLISYLRFSGIYNSLLNKKSWYRGK